jgi:hypothetical protein
MEKEFVIWESFQLVCVLHVVSGMTGMPPRYLTQHAPRNTLPVWFQLESLERLD